jgi:acid phosphatase
MNRLPTLLAALLLTACATTPAPPPAAVAAAPAPTATAQPAANDNLNAVAWTQTAIEHDLIYREVYRQAQEKLLGALHDATWDALPHDERHGAVDRLKPAVVLDVDETVLDNSPHAARLVRSGGEFNEADWDAWVNEQAATALPGALEFTQFAAAHGIAVIYITNRDQSESAATRANLKKLGFPVSGPDALLGLGTVVPGCTQVRSDKTCRREKVGSQYRVLMQIGDQIGDFLAVKANTVDGRRAAMRPYLGWIGERWFVLPNATYGSWEPALFGNDWSQPPAQRRKAKLDALRY